MRQLDPLPGEAVLPKYGIFPGGTVAETYNNPSDYVKHTMDPTRWVGQRWPPPGEPPADSFLACYKVVDSRSGGVGKVAKQEHADVRMAYIGLHPEAAFAALEGKPLPLGRLPRGWVLDATNPSLTSEVAVTPSLGLACGLAPASVVDGDELPLGLP